MTGPKTTGEPPISQTLRSAGAEDRRKFAVEMAMRIGNMMQTDASKVVSNAKVILAFIEATDADR